MTPPSKPRRALKLLLLQLVLWPLLLLLAEGGLRGVLWAKGKPYAAKQARSQIRELVDRSVDFVPTLNRDHPIAGARTDMQVRMLHPFAGYCTVGGLRFLELHTKRLETGAADEEYEILILGGSVAQMFGQFGKKRFINLLKNDPRFADREVVFLNFGEGGYKQPQQVGLLSFLFTMGVEPEAVLHIDGYNEAALGSRNITFGSHPNYPSIPLWGHLVPSWSNDRAAMDLALQVRSAQRELEGLGTWALEKGAERSALLGTFVSRRLNALMRRSTEAADQLTQHLADGPAAKALEGPESPPGETTDDEVLRLWSESTLTMQAMCDVRGITYVHALQPTLYDLGSKPLAEDEVERTNGHRPDWLKAVTRLYPRMRERGAELAQQGVGFVDASGVFAETERPIYIDECHYNGPGNRILAKFLVEPFLAAVR